MKIQEIIDNLITIKEYYTPERDFSQYGEDYEPLTEIETAAIEKAIEILESLKGEMKHPEIIRCKECIYYDPAHIEKNGVRYDYKDMPKAAFDSLGTGLVHLEYGINFGGRCCRDYNVGYADDKRVFVSEQNYCGRAERRTDE